MDSKTKSFLLGTGLLIAAVLAFFFLAYKPTHSESQVLTIYCWDNTFREVLAKNYPAYDPVRERIGTVTVKWIIYPDLNSVYQTELDQVLKQQPVLDSEHRVDIFLAEADYIRKYTGTDKYALSLAELGITEDELAEHFPYTRQAARDELGIERGISYQATPGVMLYRRDMAKEIFGTDDPAKVQELFDNWSKFEQASDQVKAAGGTMLGGFFDTYRVFSSSRHTSWLNGAEITMGPSLAAWVNQTQKFASEGKLLPNELWDPEWSKAVRSGRTFAFFGPAWFIDDAFILSSLKTPLSEGGALTEGNGTFGKWGACEGPEPFFWGGTWICAAQGTDNKELIADIMRTLCCNDDTARQMCSGDKLSFVNNRAVMRERAQDKEAGLSFLAGQNPYGIMADVAEKVPDPVRQMTPYDQGLHEMFRLSCTPYFRRQESWNQVWQRFLATVWLLYPELQDAASLQ